MLRVGACSRRRSCSGLVDLTVPLPEGRRPIARVDGASPASACRCRRLRNPARPAMSTPWFSGEASVHQWGACVSSARRPPAARAAATLALPLDPRARSGVCVRPRPRWEGAGVGTDVGLRLCRSTTSSPRPRLLYPSTAAQKGPYSPGILRHGDAYHLDLGGVWLDLQPPSLDRDPAGQLDIALAQGPVLSGGCADRHSLRPPVNVGEMADALGNLGDRRHEPGAMLERPDTEVGVCAREQDPPILDSVSVVEGSSRRSLLVHPGNHSSHRERSWLHHRADRRRGLRIGPPSCRAPAERTNPRTREAQLP